MVEHDYLVTIRCVSRVCSTVIVDSEYARGPKINLLNKGEMYLESECATPFFNFAIFFLFYSLKKNALSV